MNIISRDGRLIAIYNKIEISLNHKCYDSFDGSADELISERILDYSFFYDRSGEITEVRVSLDREVEPIVFRKY